MDTTPSKDFLGTKAMTNLNHYFTLKITRLIMTKTSGVIFFGFFILSIFSCIHENEKTQDDPMNKDWKVLSREFIDSCASDFSVDYSLFSKDNQLFVAYYDPQHQLTLAKREISGKWTYSKIPEFVDWDEHKSIKIALDKKRICTFVC